MLRHMMRNRGGALLLATIIVLIVAGLTGAFYSISMINSRSTANATFALQALYAAEAGAGICIADMNRGGAGILSGTCSGASYAITRIDYGSDGKDNDGNGKADDPYEANFVELNVRGSFNGMVRTLSIVLTRAGGGVYWNALFAGNRSGDSNYSLLLGGLKQQADVVHGNVYSGGSIFKTGDASISPYPRQDPDNFLIMSNRPATDNSSQRPPPEYSLGSQSALDLLQMRYETNNDVNVKEGLNAAGTLGSNPAGGSALQILDPDNPAHIFRMNPSDRTALTTTTVKNDYFLEDPTEPLRLDPNWTGEDAYHLRLSTARGNHVVYYIDGNLWLNNRYTYSFKFYHPEPTGIKVTFVAKGNIYFGDNLFYLNINKDAVAFIAMKDPDVPDSGNIYFGDPLYGTTRRFEGYMYADNNFYDNNLGT
ncbi:MAG: pilus assembly PilX N-terminal domain-containing protein [Planctomycetes bacterium]|nr:pilus assembly PilX N-terminal domain-containing protein [Planctomycetota bacterium]